MFGRASESDSKEKGKKRVTTRAKTMAKKAEKTLVPIGRKGPVPARRDIRRAPNICNVKTRHQMK